MGAIPGGVVLTARRVSWVAVFAASLVMIACFGSDNEDPTVTPTQARVSVTETPEATVEVPTSAPATETPTAEPSPTPTLTPAEPIAWTPCDSGPFECASYDVPLDYANPGDDTISLALRLQRAESPDQRIGLLFVNPGGPGGSTIDILSAWVRTLPFDLRARFDIVLMDPRGVGHSSPLICHDNIQELIGLEPYPASEEDWQVIEDATREFAERCGEVGANVLPFLGTADVARDIDRLREASGEETITYFGYSYGTTLGQVYADLFPDRVRAMVLDGAVDTVLPSEQRALEQTLGFEAAYNRYLAYCADIGCLAGDPATTIQALLDETGVSPIAAPGGDRPLGRGEALYGIVQAMYSRALWPILSAALNSALDGDGSSLLFLSDSYSGRNDDGTYSNGSEANSAVNCLDYVSERDPQHYRDVSVSFGEQAPVFGPATGQLGLYCALWPVDPKPISPPVAEGAPPIIVIGTTGDPATPYKWAVSVADRLESGFLITNDAEGHLAYRYGDSCVDDAVEAYLLDLTLPPEGLRCGDAGIEPVPAVN